jgi:hypothetical protein
MSTLKALLSTNLRVVLLPLCLRRSSTVGAGCGLVPDAASAAPAGGTAGQAAGLAGCTAAALQWWTVSACCRQHWCTHNQEVRQPDGLRGPCCRLIQDLLYILLACAEHTPSGAHADSAVLASLRIGRPTAQKWMSVMRLCPLQLSYNAALCPVLQFSAPTILVPCCQRQWGRCC